MTKQKLDRNAYKAKVQGAAHRMAVALGIPALEQFAITQSADESGLGNSELAATYNNYFGIKNEVKATVPRTTVNLPTKEVENGQTITVNAIFAAYRTIDDCFMDWGNYILRKYPEAAAAARANDSDAFFQALQDGGYATNPTYAADLDTLHQELWA